MLNEKIYTTIKNPVISEKAAIEKSTSNGMAGPLSPIEGGSTVL